MTVRRVLLWGLPVVFVVSLAFFILAPPLIQRQSQTADAIRQAGMNGMIWFFPSLIAILWLATYFNLLPGVFVAVSIGSLSLIIFGGPMIQVHFSSKFLINPGVFATYGDVIGAVLGGLGRGKRIHALRWSVILAVVGLIIGYAIGFVYLFIQYFPTIP